MEAPQSYNSMLDRSATGNEVFQDENNAQLLKGYIGASDRRANRIQGMGGKGTMDNGDFISGSRNPGSVGLSDMIYTAANLKTRKAKRKRLTELLQGDDSVIEKAIEDARIQLAMGITELSKGAVTPQEALSDEDLNMLVDGVIPDTEQFRTPEGNIDKPTFLAALHTNLSKAAETKTLKGLNKLVSQYYAERARQGGTVGANSANGAVGSNPAMPNYRTTDAANADFQANTSDLLGRIALYGGDEATKAIKGANEIEYQGMSDKDIADDYSKRLDARARREATAQQRAESSAWHYSQAASNSQAKLLQQQQQQAKLGEQLMELKTKRANRALGFGDTQNIMNSGDAARWQAFSAANPTVTQDQIFAPNFDPAQYPGYEDLLGKARANTSIIADYDAQITRLEDQIAALDAAMAMQGVNTNAMTTGFGGTPPPVTPPPPKKLTAQEKLAAAKAKRLKQQGKTVK